MFLMCFVLKIIGMRLHGSSPVVWKRSSLYPVLLVINCSIAIYLVIYLELEFMYFDLFERVPSTIGSVTKEAITASEKKDSISSHFLSKSGGKGILLQ